MPGLEYYSKTETAPAASSSQPEPPRPVSQESLNDGPSRPGVYYNPRMDPKNYLEGPLSVNAATRLRQMLARPGIVVRHETQSLYMCNKSILQVAPGICDGISARCAIEAGFDCMYQRYVFCDVALRIF